MNCNEPLEIERRFLILRPSEDELKSRCSRIYQMEQTYLLAPPHQTERVRRREGDGVSFFHTVKIDRTACTRVEQEEEITPEEYEDYLTRRDPMTHTIRKTRYCLQSGPFTFEIDFYPFWPSYAVMEIELPRATRKGTSSRVVPIPLPEPPHQTGRPSSSKVEGP